ncbi:MAG: hypothetical protein SW833_25585 [Cyanobacteriota bacterium]|nr:hypothetical protein [Cyanobacteriota bacterium]
MPDYTTLNPLAALVPTPLLLKTHALPGIAEVWSPVFEESLVELLEVVERLTTAQPLCSSQDLRNLAEKAINSLSNRYDEESWIWADDLARDVAGAID